MLYRLQSEDREEQIHGLVCMCVYMGCMSGRKLWGLRVLRVFSPRVHIYGDFEISLILSLLLARSLLTWVLIQMRPQCSQFSTVLTLPYCFTLGHVIHYLSDPWSICGLILSFFLKIFFVNRISSLN